MQLLSKTTIALVTVFLVIFLNSFINKIHFVPEKLVLLCNITVVIVDIFFLLILQLHVKLLDMFGTVLLV